MTSNVQQNSRAQTLAIEVRSETELLSHAINWCAGADESTATIVLPRGGEVVITTPSLGKVGFEGFVQLDMRRSSGDRRVLVWANSARSRDDFDCDSTVTLNHPNSDFPEIPLNITCEEEASLEVDEGAAPAQPSAAVANVLGSGFATFIADKGAYVVSAFAVIGALIFALLIPAHQNDIVVAAVAIAAWSFWATEPGDRFGMRILAFVAAAAFMVASMVMPAQAKELISAAGVACFVAIYWGNQF
jgi:hypothetical protein